MKVALAQLNPTVGDIDGNAARILESVDQAQTADAELVVFPELVVMGYPPKDLLLREDLIRRNVEAVERVAAACTKTTAVVGYVRPDPTGSGTGNFNAAAVCHQGRIIASYAKRLLPTYDVFDESRYFNPGASVTTFDLPTGDATTRIGLTICEDLWNDRQFETKEVYDVDPIAQTVDAGADLIVNLSASPYRAGVQRHREDLFASQARDHHTPLVYVNQVGGNDDLIFDGTSILLDAEGYVRARANAFEQDMLVVDLDDLDGARVEPYPEAIEGIRGALVLGIRDYLAKCGFSGVVIGLSGGIDSALTAALAVEAVGAQHVHGVAMPSRYSSDHSVEDARRLAENLGVDFRIIEIESVHQAFEEALVPILSQCVGDDSGIAEENIQARIRGNILMALSNKSGSLLITTGNKSELAVGYCTLYGDMCGGLAVLSDVPKTVVYQLARHINESEGRELIPQRTIDKPPSAELRPDQKDQDSLPPYEMLDAILERHVERELAVDAIVEEGFDRATVERVADLVHRAEYKRKQAPIGLKVTSRAFGTGRRMPIAARYR